MDYVKKLFRYKTSSVCFLLGCIASFVAMYFVVATERDVANGIKMLEQHDYQYRCEFELRFDGEKQVEIPNYGIGNCMLQSLGVSLDSQGIIVMSWILAYNNEEIKLPLASGGWPTKEDIEREERVAVLGIKYRNQCTHRDGKDYFMINGEEYYISGFLSGDISTEFDSYVLLFYDALGELTRIQLLKEDTAFRVNAVLESDLYDVASLSYDFSRDFEAYGKAVPIHRSHDAYERVITFRDKNYFLIFAYSLCICVLVSVFWVYERKKEMHIRRAFGYRVADVLKMLFGEFILILLIGIVIAFIVTALAQKYILEGVISLHNFLINAAAAMCMCILVPLISLLVPAMILRYKMPISEISKKEI